MSHDRSLRRLLDGALLVAAAGLFANTANLGVSVIIAHLLGSTQYGSYSQLIGLYFVISLPGSAIAVAVIRRGSLFSAAGDLDAFASWRTAVRRQSTRVALFSVLLWALATQALHVVLGGPSSGAIFLVGLGALAWVFLNLERALLQVGRRYWSLASNFLAEGIVRTVAVVLLAHWGLVAIAGAIAASELLTWIHVRRLVGGDSPHRWSETTGVGVRTGIPLVTLSLLAGLQYLDVFLVGRFNHPHSGSYATVAQVSKLLVYVAFILTSFLIPETTLSVREGRIATRPLALGGVILSLMAAPMALVAAVAPRQILSMVFPARDLGAAHSLFPLVIAMWVLGFLVLGCAFLLAAGVRSHVVILVALLFAGAAWVGQAKGHANETAWHYVEALSLGAVAMFAYLMWIVRNPRQLPPAT